MAAGGFSELVPPPAEGRVFERRVQPGFADCAPSGRARLDGMARWLQDVAYADVVDAGLDEVAVWVVRRTRLRVRRYPRFGERLVARTYCSGLGAMWGERCTSISRAGEPAPDVESVALWVHLDPLSWRPAPFAPAELALYGPPAAGRRVRARLHHPLPPAAPAERRTWAFRAAEADIAAHVNNTAYWVPLEEEMLAGGASDPECDASRPADDVASLLDAEIEFRAPAQPGVVELLAEGEMRWIVGADGEVHASARVRGGLPTPPRPNAS